MSWLETIWDIKISKWDSTVQKDNTWIYKLYKPTLAKENLKLYQNIQNIVSNDIVNILLSTGIKIRSSNFLIKKVRVKFHNIDSELLKYCEGDSKKEWYTAKVWNVDWNSLYDELESYYYKVEELYSIICSHVEKRTWASLHTISRWKKHYDINPMNIKVTQIWYWEIEITVTDISTNIERFVKKFKESLEFK